MTNDHKNFPVLFIQIFMRLIFGSDIWEGTQLLHLNVLQVVAPPRQELLGVALIRYNDLCTVTFLHPHVPLYSDLFHTFYFKKIRGPLVQNRTRPYIYIYISPWFPILLNCSCMLGFDWTLQCAFIYKPPYNLTQTYVIKTKATLQLILGVILIIYDTGWIWLVYFKAH